VLCLKASAQLKQYQPSSINVYFLIHIFGKLLKLLRALIEGCSSLPSDVSFIFVEVLFFFHEVDLILNVVGVLQGGVKVEAILMRDIGQLLNPVCDLEVKFLSQAKVSNLEHVSILDEDVGWLDVSVDQTPLVDVLETVEQLLEEYEVCPPVYLPAFVLYELLQSQARTVFHLDHQVKSDKVFAVLDELEERVLREVLIFILGRRLA
jgi:hypothetical protein